MEPAIDQGLLEKIAELLTQRTACGEWLQDEPPSRLCRRCTYRDADHDAWNFLDALFAACATQFEAGMWRPIESAPKDGTHIFAIAAGQHLPTLIAWNTWEGCWADHPAPARMLPVRRVVFQPSHWMPLPSPPKAEDGQ